LDSNQR